MNDFWSTAVASLASAAVSIILSAAFEREQIAKYCDRNERFVADGHEYSCKRIGVYDAHNRS